MKYPLSPLDIEVLLWCHTRPGPHENIDATAVRNSLGMWIAASMIYHDPIAPDYTYTPTEKGRAFIQALCRCGQTPEQLSEQPPAPAAGILPADDTERLFCAALLAEGTDVAQRVLGRFLDYKSRSAEVLKQLKG